VRDFGAFSGAGLHVASMQPGAIRGNHTHERDEIICIIGGSGVCEIAAGGEEIMIEGDLKAYRIKAGIRHTIRNTGNQKFYLVCFYLGDELSEALL
jgi:mannose-6-phosphate isomerase-like protein (cupin superfamily)